MWLKNNDTSTAEHELQHLNQLTNENSDTKSYIGFKDLFRDRGTTKGFIIALGLMIGQQLCGISAIVCSNLFTYLDVIRVGLLIIN